MESLLDKVKQRAGHVPPLVKDIISIGTVIAVRAAANLLGAIRLKHVLLTLSFLAVGLWAFIIGSMNESVRTDGTVVPSKYREEQCSDTIKDGDYVQCRLRYHKDSDLKIFIGKK